MLSEPKTIDVEPGSEIDRLLDEAAERPLRLVRSNRTYLLTPEDVFAGYDPERARAGILAAAGSWRHRHADDIRSGYDPEKARESTLAFSGAWRDIDAEAFKAYIRERRKTKNRPSLR